MENTGYAKTPFVQLQEISLKSLVQNTHARDQKCIIQNKKQTKQDNQTKR